MSEDQEEFGVVRGCITIIGFGIAFAVLIFWICYKVSRLLF